MARIRYHDFRQEDSTLLFNNRFRGILRAGVYLGFNVSPGSGGGWWLQFTHDTDPDNAGALLGTIITHDGLIIQENANQDDVVLGAIGAGVPNIHYVVASYTYNASLPNNDVSYTVRQGVSGLPPIPPVLTDDEVLLAEIYVPGGSGSYGAVGVEIRNVAKLDLYADSALPSMDMLNVIKPGITDGIAAYPGTLWDDVSLEAGTWVTNENFIVTEPAAQVDLMTITNPGVGLYRYVWVIGAHKFADEDPYPTPDYLLVEGAPAVFGVEAVLPTALAVRTAVATLNVKYDTDGDGFAEVEYVNYLGYIKVTNIAATILQTHVRGKTVLQDNTIFVHGGEADAPGKRSGEYYGYVGLRQAIDDVYALTKDIDTLKQAYTLILDGDFEIPDATLHLPSNIRLLGAGAGARIASEEPVVLDASGWVVEWNAVNNTVAQAAGPAGPPAGYTGRTFTIGAVYQVGDSIQDHRFCAGDDLYFYSDATATVYRGIFVQSTGPWSFELYIQNQYNADGNPLDLDILLFKMYIHLENIRVSNVASGTGFLQCKYMQNSSLKNVSCVGFKQAILWYSKIDLIVDGTITWADGVSSWPSTTPGYYSYGNQYHNIRSDLAVGFGQVVIGPDEYNSSFGSIHTIGDGVDLGGQGNLVSLCDCATLRIINGTNNLKLLYTTATTITDLGADTSKFRILQCSINNPNNELLEQFNQNPNIRLLSDATITWNSATEELSWDAPLYLDHPFVTGYNRIAVAESLSGGVATLQDGDHVYVVLDRTSAGMTDRTWAGGTIFKTAKAAAAGDNKKQNLFLLLVRYGDDVYFSEGTRIENGQEVKIGQTPPPDGSVTYPKLAPSAKAFHNEFFHDYVVPEVDGWENDSIFINTLLRTFIYTPATGVIQYSAAVDLSSVVPGDRIILRNTYHAAAGGLRAFTVEEILAVNDGANNVTITQGLEVTPGAAGLWNGAIVRGNKLLTNDAFVTFTYDNVTGRILYGSNMLFSQYQVQVGDVFIDSSLNKFEIIAADAAGTGSWVDLQVGLGDEIDVTVPTTKHHGSIESNNNPHNLKISDMRVVGGSEFIPIDLPTDPDQLVPVTGVRPAFGNFGTYDCYNIMPYDIRVRSWLAKSSGSEVVMNDDPNGIMNYKYPAGIIEFTGVCTAVIPVICGDTADKTFTTYWVDGVNYSAAFGRSDAKVTTNSYLIEQNRYEPVGTPADAIWAIRMPQGVHNVRINAKNLRGLIIVNQPQHGDYLPVVLESPGKAVQDGGVVEYDTVHNVAIPTDPTIPATGWGKGGRILRYAKSDGTKAWASQWVKNNLGIGTISNGSANITNVAVPTDWHVSDLIMTVDPGANVKHIRRITSIVGTTITVNAIYGYNDVGGTLYFYGNTNNMVGGVSGKNSQHAGEEVVQVINSTDFAAGGFLGENSGAAVYNAVARTTAFIGVYLSDLNTYIASDTAVFDGDAGGAIMVPIGDTLTVGFIGTGISVGTSGNCIYTIDGFGIGTLATSSDNAHDDIGGSYVVSNLPYGQHILQITSSAGICYLSSFTIWGPKKPVIPTADLPALELWDTCTLGYTDADLVVNSVNGIIVAPQLGMVHYDWGSIINPGTTPQVLLNDVSIAVANTSYGNRVHDWGGGGVTTAAPKFYTSFFGDQITFVTHSVTDAGGNINVTIKDHDGQMKAPTFTTGFSTQGSATLVTHVVPGTRHRYIFSEVGWHTILIEGDSTAGQDIEFDAVEIHTLFHNHKLKQPVSIDLHTPHNHGGLDIRPLTPYPEEISSNAHGHYQSIDLNIAATTIIVEQQPFWFYSPGGMVEISCNASCRDDTGGGGGGDLTAIIGIDSDFTGALSFYTHCGDVELNHLYVSRTCRLKKGMHYACLAGSAPIGNFAFRWCTWSARFIAPFPHGLKM